MKVKPHPKEARKLWHRGKRQRKLNGRTESKVECLRRCFKEGNYKGAYTPTWMKHGVLYNPESK